MADTQNTNSNSRWGDFNMEISFEWGTTGISINIYNICNAYNLMIICFDRHVRVVIYLHEHQLAEYLAWDGYQGNCLVI